MCCRVMPFKEEPSIWSKKDKPQAEKPAAQRKAEVIPRENFLDKIFEVFEKKISHKGLRH